MKSYEDKVDKLFQILGERDLPPMPDVVKEKGVCYTDYLTGAHKFIFSTDPKTKKNYIYTPDRNRQCSIGYHGECSDPHGKKCGCPCHPIMKLLK